MAIDRLGLRYKIIEKNKWNEQNANYNSFDMRIFEKGEKVGFVSLLHFRKPFNCFYIQHITVEEKYRHKRHSEHLNVGRRILENIENFLKKMNAVGFLGNLTGDEVNNNPIEVQQNYYKNWKPFVPGRSEYLYFSGRVLSPEEMESFRQLVVAVG